MDIDKVVDDRLAADADFQTRISTLSDDEKESETSKKRKEVLADEFLKRENNYQAQKQRAENAEKERDELKNKGTPPAQEKKDDLSSSDLYALHAAGVHPDDVAEVTKASKLLGKTIAETLADAMVLGILSRNTEKRASAKAANTGDGRGGPKEKSDEQVLEDATKNDKIPEKGSPEAEALFRARRGIKNK